MAAGAALALFVLVNSLAGVLLITLVLFSIISLFIMNLRIFAAESGCVWQGVGIGGYVASAIIAIGISIPSLVANFFPSVLQNLLMALVPSTAGAAASAFMSSNTLPECMRGL